MTGLEADLKGCNLKKQSQYLKGQNDAKSVITIVYGDLYRWRQRKNKAKQSQSPAFGPEILNKAGGEEFLSLAVLCG